MESNKLLFTRSLSNLMSLKKARAVQDERFKDLKDVYSNAQMPGRMVREVCKLTPEGLILLKTAMERLQPLRQRDICTRFAAFAPAEKMIA